MTLFSMFVIGQVLRDPYDDSLQFAIVSVPSGVERWKSLAYGDDDEYVTSSHPYAPYMSILASKWQLVRSHFISGTSKHGNLSQT